MNDQLKTRIASPGPKKILLCDGGGILGLIRVEILAKSKPLELKRLKNPPSH